GLGRKTADDAGRPVDLERLAVDEGRERDGRAHHRGNAELARDDCGMRQRAADLGDDRGRAREQRDPRHVRRLAHEDVAVPELREVLEVAHQACRPACDTGRRWSPTQRARRIVLHLAIEQVPYRSGLRAEAGVRVSDRLWRFEAPPPLLLRLALGDQRGEIAWRAQRVTDLVEIQQEDLLAVAKDAVAHETGPESS